MCQELNAVRKTSDTRTDITSIKLRPYEIQDRDVVNKIWYEGMVDIFDIATQPVLVRLLVAWCESQEGQFDNVPAFVRAGNGGCLFVAVDDSGAIVGVVGLKITDEDKAMRRAELVRLAVPRELRGHGIGNLLMAFIVEHARVQLKLESIWLETTSPRIAGLRLFERYGFKEFSRKKGGSRQEDSVDFQWILLMEKRFLEDSNV